MSEMLLQQKAMNDCRSGPGIEDVDKLQEKKSKHNIFCLFSFLFGLHPTVLGVASNSIQWMSGIESRTSHRKANALPPNHTDVKC